jgi:hypothetical protein
MTEPAMKSTSLADKKAHWSASVRVRRWRRFVVALLMLVGLAGAAVFVVLAPESPGVTLTTLARLIPGMSESQVSAVLGPPSDDVTGRPPPGVPRAAPGGRLLLYAGDRAMATVEFGPEGHLIRCHPVIRTVTFPERIRLRLNLW